MISLTYPILEKNNMDEAIGGDRNVVSKGQSN